MQITAIFESWHIGDGNYPPLSRDQLVRLSFELEPKIVSTRSCPAAPRLEHLGDGEYRGVARVLRSYRVAEYALAVIDTGDLRFSISSREATSLERGDCIEFAGTLVLDHFIWVEYPERYPDPPDLFYNLRVARIRKVNVPERFISRHIGGKALPTRVEPADFEAVQELATMEEQPFDEEFYVIDFDSEGVEGTVVPLTFIQVPPR